MSDWLPYRDGNGRYVVHDWLPVRAAIDAARRELGETGSIAQRDWNLVLLAMQFNAHQSRPTCVECNKVIDGVVIKCLDCRGALHEECAPRHFWPDGRPADTLPHWKATP